MLEYVVRMAKCQFCDKGVTFGIKVSHSHRRSNRMWKPNVKRVKVLEYVVRGAQAAPWGLSAGQGGQMALRNDKKARFLNSKEVQRMAKCQFCDKGVTFGIKVSHSHPCLRPRGRGETEEASI